MIHANDILDFGPLGMKFTIIETAAESDGGRFAFDMELAPHTGGTPLHVHPRATEIYEVLDGTLELNVGGSWKTLTKGDREVIAPGTPHTFRNSSDQITRVSHAHQPALNFGAYFEGLHRLANSGVIASDKMTLTAILHLADLMSSHAEDTRCVQPPHFVMRAMAFIARRIGYVA